LLTNVRTVLNLSLSSTLGESVKGIAETVDPDFANSPPFLLLKYFKSLDIDVRFNSTSELPEPIR